ncbi:baculoviral IAP repeat-containing protein 7-A [Harmonia axyridis]|uniref:baculoviral IAP repeat-containing protein 7-A n=1 Tax=Harmonia axyridis TaxID=115357 RepID=UPI001E27665E|nr:baculoviral IAP repeat-containing protein 7-A [Harmonia axyridis]
MMNSEKNRLETFSDWPSNAPISPARIAKAGFYSTKEGLTVKCFACEIQILEWNYGDQVMAKHKNVSPTCPFVLNPTTSGNVPIITQIYSTPSVSTNLNYKDEAVRLSSFRNWPVPHIVAPESLARAGFYYYDCGDNTKCAFCNGVMTSWLPEDDPDKEHKRHFPTCPFVISTISPRLLERLPRDNTLTNVDLVSNENLDTLGVNAHKIPKKPSCATLESRLRTFNTWPSQLIQTPEDLANAGFYYEGINDQVRCFHCDGGLRHWDPEDDPWTEHARWFPLCSFVKIVKGQEFIVSCSKAQMDGKDKKKLHNMKPKPVRKFPVTEADLEQHMSSSVVVTALNIGLSIDRIKRALKEKLEQTGTAFSEPDSLAFATLNLQIDEQRSEVESECMDDYNDFLFRSYSDNVSPEDSSPTTSEDTSAKISPNTSKKLSLEEENRILKEQRLCKVCMDVEVGVVFLPCGHFATCVNCAPNLQDCPVCRTQIKATVRTFLA